MLPRNRVRQFDDLLLGELESQTAPKVVAHNNRSARQTIGELDHDALGCSEVWRVDPIVHGIDLCLVEAQLTAERSREILSPHAPDHRRGA